MFTLNGTIYKKNTPGRVAQVFITNVRTKSLFIADDLGRFHAQAIIGDSLLLKKIGFTPQIFVITSTLDVNVFLQPIVLLDEITIKEQTKKQEINEAMGLYKKSGGYYTLTPSAWSMINSPVTGLYEALGEDPNRARRFQEKTREELEHIEIFKRYNKALIKQVTGLTDDKEVQHFTDVFTPAYQDIKTWTDYEVINYIKISYNWYKTHKDDVKMQILY